MKSRTSSFNLTVFKKDLTRFAPAWAVYLIILMLTLLGLANDGEAYYRVRNVSEAINVVSWANIIYAAVVAQLLFGDLYNSRLCNALHALPVTREGWFGSHTAAGLVFSLIPNLVIALLALPVLNLGAGRVAIFWWLLAAELQYIFFFGTAVLCVMLAGNRLGMLAIYAMIHFAGLAGAWLASSIYEPLLYGIQIDTEIFYPFCPLAYFTQLPDPLVIDAERIEDAFGNYMYHEIYGVAPGAGWGYMTLCAGLGILALIVGLVLYRKRKLECAGDFVAFKSTEPVVQVLVTLFAGGFFHLFGDVFGMRLKYVLIFCGMVVGFFACRMLLMRTNRVFQKKAFLGCGAILAAFALTLGLTAWDPAGITTYMPESDEVESVTFSTAYSLYRHEDFPFTATDTDDIEAILSVHADCIDRSADSIRDTDWEAYSLFNLRLEYTLKNGRTVNRFYSVHPNSKAGQVLKGYFTRPECVLGFTVEQAPKMTDFIRSIYVNGMTDRQQYELENLDLEGMMAAIIADCEAGNMAQIGGFHYPTNYDLLEGEYDEIITYLEIGWDHERLETAMQGKTNSYGIISYANIRIYRSCENTLKWLEDNGLLTEEMQKEMVIKYGGPTTTFETES